MREESYKRLSHKEPKVTPRVIEEFEPNVKYGIHDKPLPHFSEHQKEWWLTQRGYCEQPKEISQLQLMHKIMKKNPTDIFLFADKGIDKAGNGIKILRKRKNEVAEKPNNVKKLLKGKVLKKNKTTMRWTDAELLYGRKKERLFDKIPEARAAKADIEPMYSSFNPKHIFKAPPSSKEALSRQMKEEKRDIQVQGTNHSQTQDPENTTYQLLDPGKTTFFKRVKTAYGRRRNTALGKDENPWFNLASQMTKEKTTFKSSSQVGFRTGAFTFK